MSSKDNLQSRRQFAGRALAAGAGVLAAGPVLAQSLPADVVPEPQGLKRRVSGSMNRDWREHFPTLKNDAILCDLNDRVLHYWSEDGFYRIYPTSVPFNEDMTRRGRTEIVHKRPAPEWRPTPSMIERNPDLPRYVGPGPENPLGVRALNLSWQYYLIHGTNDIRKIGRQSSSGCVGMFNEHIIEVFDRARLGTQVMVL